MLRYLNFKYVLHKENTKKTCEIPTLSSPAGTWTQFISVRLDKLAMLVLMLEVEVVTVSSLRLEPTHPTCWFSPPVPPVFSVCTPGKHTSCCPQQGLLSPLSSRSPEEPAKQQQQQPRKLRWPGISSGGSFFLFLSLFSEIGIWSQSES